MAKPPPPKACTLSASHTDTSLPKNTSSIIILRHPCFFPSSPRRRGSLSTPLCLSYVIPYYFLSFPLHYNPVTPDLIGGLMTILPPFQFQHPLAGGDFRCLGARCFIALRIKTCHRQLLIYAVSLGLTRGSFNYPAPPQFPRTATPAGKAGATIMTSLPVSGLLNAPTQ